MKVSLRAGFRRDDPVSPLDGVLRDCREMGFDGIELMLDPRNPFGSSGPRSGRGPWSSESVTPEIREELRQSAGRHGVEIATLSADRAWGYVRYHPRLSQWERRMVGLHSSQPSVQIDYGEMLAALREVGYDGWWVFEVGWEQARQSLEDWRFIMGRSIACRS